MHFPNLTECLKNPLEDHHRYALIFPTQNPYSDSTSSLDQAMATLLQRSLVSRSQSSNSLTCHSIVKEAVLNTIEHQHKCETFMRTVFILNARFPSLEYGFPLLEQWEECEKYRPHVSSLLQAYKGYPESLNFPILLREIIRRCAWSVGESSIYGNHADQIGTFSREELSAIPRRCWRLDVKFLRARQHLLTTLAITGYILTD